MIPWDTQWVGGSADSDFLINYTYSSRLERKEEIILRKLYLNSIKFKIDDIHGWKG